MDILSIWNFIAGNNSSVNIFEFSYDCTIFCMFKKITVDLFKLELKDNEIYMYSTNKNIYYKLKYINDRSIDTLFFFECKQIGGNNDLYLTLDFNTYEKFISCNFKDVKPKSIKYIHYNSFSHRIIERVQEQDTHYKSYYIKKPINILPPSYDTIISNE